MQNITPSPIPFTKLPVDPPRALSTKVYGEQNVEKILFVGGFPDNLSLFEHQAEYFSDRFMCICACTPDYDRPESQAKVDGYTFEEVADMLQRTVEMYVDTANREKFILVGHDFGVLWCNLYLQKNFLHVKKFIMVDIGLFDNSDTDMALARFQYQNTLHKEFTQYHKRDKRHLPMTGKETRSEMDSSIMKDFEKKYRFGQKFATQRAEPWMAWPYQFTQRKLNFRLPPCPILFIYSNKSRVKFHSKQFLNQLEYRGDGSRHVAMNTGHWIMREDPKGFNEKMESFLLDRAAL